MSLDPIIFFFIMGIVAGLLKVHMRLPAPIYDFLSMILLIAIGLKGGIELSKQSFGEILPAIIAITAMGFVLPLLAYPILKSVGKLKKVDAASIAAHYGSVSVGTYAVAISYLTALGITYESYMPLFVVLLEIPAILVGIIIVKGITKETDWKSLSHEVFLGKSVVLLVGSLVIGWIAGAEKIAPIGDLFFSLFKGVLALFLLEMGLIAASQLNGVKKYGLFLIAFGVIFPLFSAIIGILIAMAVGFSVGGATMVAVLAASASYIAVPAAMRMTLPEADPSISITASLAITFPFNVTLGIPIYLWMAQQFNTLIGGN